MIPGDAPILRANTMQDTRTKEPLGKDLFTWRWFDDGVYLTDYGGNYSWTKVYRVPIDPNDFD